MSVVGERVGGGYPSTTDCRPRESALWCHHVTATQQTRDIDTMLA